MFATPATRMSSSTLRKMHTIEEMRHLAEQRRGQCLSGKYHNSRQKLLWRCANGHRWSALPGNVLKGSWCPYCARRVRGSIQEMKEIAAVRGGECLSDIYVNRRGLLQWRCAEGHVWSAPASALVAGKWCIRCSLIEKYTIEDICKLAIERGGACKSLSYVNLQQPITWQCAAGHTWQASSASVLAGTWCPVCAHNQRLELTEMQRIAALRGGLCLSSSYVNNHTPLLWSCSEGHTWKAAPQNVRRSGQKQGTWCPVCAESKRQFRQRLTIEQAQEIAIAHGGLCLSEQYFGSKSKLTWQCARGHIWQALITPVRRGSWCPECAGNRKLDLDLFHRLAAERGGQCLSETYVNKDTPLKFRCSQGHIWTARPREIKRGAWCIICGRVLRQRRYRQNGIQRRVFLREGLP